MIEQSVFRSFMDSNQQSTFDEFIKFLDPNLNHVVIWKESRWNLNYSSPSLGRANRRFESLRVKLKWGEECVLVQVEPKTLDICSIVCR